MADQWHGAQPAPGERWNVNLPAVVGVVFIFLVGVVIWVIVASDDDESATPDSPAATVAPSIESSVPATVTTSPLPMPSTVVVVPTEPVPTSPPTTAPVATTAPVTAPPVTTAALSTAPPEDGDLGVPGYAMQRPPCNGDYITILGSAIGDEATPDGMRELLEQYPESNYLRTDLTCPSLTQSQAGEPIYVVYFGPFVVDTDACAARAEGPTGAYVRRLSSDLTPDHRITCP